MRCELTVTSFPFTLNAVVLSHAHMDHCGAVPLLYKMGYKGPLYCTTPTRDLMVLLCMDYIEISSFNSEWTIMVHMNGDNDLESAGINDFLEMASIGSTDEVNIVVQFDRISGFSEDYDNWNTTKRYFITKDITPDNVNATMDLGEKWETRWVI